MNSNTYMDKQIMDLSNSQNNNNNNTTDFIDFMNRSEKKEEEANPSYDFMSIRPAVESSSSNEPLMRSWNSFDLKKKSSPIRNYSSLDADEPGKLFLNNKNLKPVTASPDASWISEIDRTMKKYTDNLMHAMDCVTARLSQLETRTGHLENMVDDLKLSVGNNHGSTDGKMRHIENILREVQTGVVAIRDKQEIVDAQLKIAKLNVSVVEQVDQKTAPSDSTQQGASTYQQFPSNALTQPPPTHLAPNAPPQHNFPPQVQLPNQFPQNQVPSVPQQEPYFPPPGPTPENPSQQYQVPPTQQQMQQHNQYHSAPQQPYSQPPPPQQPHHSFSTVNPQLPHHPEETPYPPPQTYPPSMHQSPPHPSTIPPPPSQQYYGPTPGMHEPPPSRPGPGYSGPYSPSSGHVEPYPYTNSPSQYGSGSPLKRQQHSSPFTGQGGGSSYPQLPTARILPQALPTASAVGGSSSGSGNGGSSNKVSIDDVVDKVTHMGFSRDQVRATVRKLTENGQSVDLNIVLDKLMNDGDGQAPRGWLSR